MDDPRQIYSDMLEGSKQAFEIDMFVVSYHALTAAMYCAVEAKDPGQLLEVQHLAHEHYEKLKRRAEQSPLKPPIEVGLYNSLVQMVKSRILLLPQSK